MCCTIETRVGGEKKKNRVGDETSGTHLTGLSRGLAATAGGRPVAPSISFGASE